MIFKEDLVLIGKLLKPHGIQGEITLLFEKELYTEIETPYYLLELDGIYVPFFIEEIWFNTNISARVKFEDIDSETTAAKYSNTFVFIERKNLQSIDSPEDEWDSLIGYIVEDQNGVVLGEIDSVDSSTINVLFIVKKDEVELLIPATADFITEIDDEKRLIRMELPNGLIDN
ncbi:MAG: ribosome maturation factor RimM [Dysgonamonadaceae bacterium]|jgi:16S rRNA processing protein RimM|nr:ribosome maturation factor RimM [Dysgonamonadaceae bacterium]MDD3309300.1 ribosome maturation factor RimM [Dysgonamonadaceae bacterium]MDD3900632.1 ribosome maturation factor RimM [Dysgonamonadaceae bacterium]MDD4399092.1 ribosome maturation factor RimM [Dysgonamonadaceae bacterium]MEA5081473.1 ribosome maturation factor RimM [Dysgonamonadaceae bacterium]